MVTAGGELVAPTWPRILKGVTLARVMDLARTLVGEGRLKAVVNRDIHRSEFPGVAAEVLLTSTSFDVLGVSVWDGVPVGDGRPGPVTRALAALIDAEIRSEGPRSVPLG